MFTPESLVNSNNCIEKTESLVNILYIYNNCTEKTESEDN